MIDTDFSTAIEKEEADRLLWSIVTANPVLSRVALDKKTDKITRYIVVSDESGIYECEFEGKKLVIHEVPF